MNRLRVVRVRVLCTVSPNNPVSLGITGLVSGTSNKINVPDERDDALEDGCSGMTG